MHVEATASSPTAGTGTDSVPATRNSPVGRTRTFPAADAMPERLKFAFASCQHYEQGLYTAYEQMAKDDLDLVFHLGDYIYEYPGNGSSWSASTAGRRPRRSKRWPTIASGTCSTAPTRCCAACTRVCPWFVTWDDHEFDNNYADDIQEEQDGGTAEVDPVDFLVQRAAAYQAYYEMMPLRERSLPQGPDMLLYRKASFGRLAELFVLDTRQYRTDQPNGDGLKRLNAKALSSDEHAARAKQQRAGSTAGCSHRPAPGTCWRSR